MDDKNEHKRGCTDNKKSPQANIRLPDVSREGLERNAKSNVIDDDDVLSLYAQSDYELDSDDHKKTGSTKPGTVRPSRGDKHHPPSGTSKKSNSDPDTNKFSKSKGHEKDSTDTPKTVANKRKGRIRNRNRSSSRRRNRETRNLYIGTRRLNDHRSSSHQTSISSYRDVASDPSNFTNQRLGILGDRPSFSRSVIGQNRRSGLGLDRHQVFGRNFISNQMSGDKTRGVGSEMSWAYQKLSRSAHETLTHPRGKLRESNSSRTSILGDGTLYQQRMHNRSRHGNPVQSKRGFRHKGNIASNRQPKVAKKSTEDFENAEYVSNDSQGSSQDKYSTNCIQKFSYQHSTKIDADKQKPTVSCSVDRSEDSSKAENNGLRKFSSHKANGESRVAETEIAVVSCPNRPPRQISDGDHKQIYEKTVSRSTLLPTPDIGSNDDSLPPAKKSRITLLPTPTLKTDKIDHTIKRSEKTATVAPLQSLTAMGPLMSSIDTSEISDESQSRQMDFHDSMVTPPIEVTYIIDAPPRPPNPGPTVLSSNSNSPAASRPSSRSGRYGYDRAGTPDVPPRPINPPPPISAPSPASTPEGMPPRPQNPGPPLDISLSAMSRPSLSVNPSQSNDHSDMTFEDSAVSGLLPLPAHSKLLTQGRQAAPGVEPSPAHIPVTRVGLIQTSLSSPTIRDSSIDKSSGFCPVTSYGMMSTDSSVKTLSFPEKNSAGNGLGMDVKQDIYGSDFDLSQGSVQSTVMDLSKASALISHSASSIISNNTKIEKSDMGPELGVMVSSADIDPKSKISVSASLSFSTNVVSSSYPVQSSCLTSTSTRTSTKMALLPIPVSVHDNHSSDDSKPDANNESESKQDDERQSEMLSESELKEKIITCLRNEQYTEGLAALKHAISNLPEKFGDPDVYEVIEFFGQNEVFEHVASAARLVKSPNDQLLKFLVHVTEQAPASFKGKDDDLWHIFNQVLNVTASTSAIDSFIRCFASLGSWNKIWTVLPFYGNSMKLPPSTIGLCLQAIANGEDDKHLPTGVLFLCSLPHNVKCSLSCDVINGLWLRCAENGFYDAADQVNQVRKLFPQASENFTKLSARIHTLIMELIVSNKVDSLSNFINAIGQQTCLQYLDYFVAGFMVIDEPIAKIESFLKELKQRSGRSRTHDTFDASFCVRVMRHLSQRQTWTEAFGVWRLVGELGIPCERAATLDNESQTSIALLCLEICVRNGQFDAAVSMLSESLVLGQPWNDIGQVRRRLVLLQEIFERTIETRLDYASTAFKALLTTKDTDQSIIHDYGRIIDLMSIYNDYIVGACHSGDLTALNGALELISIAHNKQLLVKPTVLRYLVVACVRFKLHTKVKEFLQRGMTVSIYPTIDVHSNMLFLPTDLATEEIAALLLLYLMLLKEYLVQALQVGKTGGDSSGGVDVLQACSITVVPNNVNARDQEFTERYQLASTEFGLLQRVQAILASGNSDPSTKDSMLNCHVDYLKSPISSELTYEGGRSVLRLNTSEVYNNVYYIEPPSD